MLQELVGTNCDEARGNPSVGLVGERAAADLFPGLSSKFAKAAHLTDNMPTIVPTTIRVGIKQGCCRGGLSRNQPSSLYPASFPL